jgi:uncharacterized protein YecT (DUF1311 family)
VNTCLLCWAIALSILAARPGGAQSSASSPPARVDATAVATAPDSIGPCAAAQIQWALTSCADSAYHRADNDLTRTYRRVLTRLGASDRMKLRAAQRAWLRFRDAQCAFEAAAYDGGSMQPMIELLCLESATRARERQVSLPRSPNDEGELP